MSCAKEIVNCLSTECHSCFSEFCGQLTRSDKLSVCSGDRHGHQCDGARDQGAVITYSGNFYLSMLRDHWDASCAHFQAGFERCIIGCTSHT
jgi:hypothetical protein